MYNIKPIVSLITLALFAMHSHAQQLYLDATYDSVSVETVNYSDVFTDNFHKMDIYQPVGDPAEKRPLLVYIHGGAFYAGDKATQDCIDFCTKFAKKGYVTASVNYRLANALVFLSNQSIQLDAVLKTMSDVKASIRYFSKDAATNNLYKIDTNAVFIGGYSAGGVAALHTAWVTDTSELDEQLISIMKAGIKDLNGDAGNYGYSSKIRGIFSLAGALYKTHYASDYDVPVYLAHAKDDETVLFNCGPALNNPMVVDLCGTGAIVPRLDSVEIIYDTMILETGGHGWPGLGNKGEDFNRAVEEIATFFYPMLLDNVRLENNTIKSTDVSVFPNPSQGNIRIMSKESINAIELYDMQGKLHLHVSSPTDMIELPLKNGIYILKIQTEESTISQRLILRK
ncbi:MAG: T9SS type A sorting domain-containing protein [Bacteroidia bacterium]